MPKTNCPKAEARRMSYNSTALTRPGRIQNPRSRASRIEFLTQTEASDETAMDMAVTLDLSARLDPLGVQWRPSGARGRIHRPRPGQGGQCDRVRGQVSG